MTVPSDHLSLDSPPPASNSHYRDNAVKSAPHLDAATMEAFSPPKQDSATAKGMVQFITPNTLSANVWRETTDLKAVKNKEQSGQ